ncbi:hypothetical protein [Frondihabitans australicus]|uniref:Uncharacterized protein n=1 Tax=Frondihabitans australicus TaxID=386892 RepID=A0A495ILT1_9MICO|nr:hypothetical protein [Frondihabitans australicus]RKR76085.1 hypothetical protein C8E83_3250 [Frondihabitans australicus]
MIDATALSTLGGELEALILDVPGVIRAQDRPAFARLTRRLASALPLGAAPSHGAITVAADDRATTLEVDLVVGGDRSAPAVAREVATVVLARLDLEDLPPAKVGVRVVAIG